MIVCEIRGGQAKPAPVTRAPARVGSFVACRTVGPMD
jgi:hypothetical protein